LSILHCIFAEGSHAIPLIITSRKTIDHEVFQKGHTPDKVMIRFPENAFIMQSLFIEWASVVLFSEIEHRRAQICVQIPDSHEAPAILIDELKQHVCDTFFDICFEGNITPHVIPAHSWDQVPPCDLCLFAAVKNILARICRDPGMDTQ
jgi:hypothetical protein